MNLATFLSKLDDGMQANGIPEAEREHVTSELRHGFVYGKGHAVELFLNGADFVAARDGDGFALFAKLSTGLHRVDMG